MQITRVFFAVWWLFFFAVPVMAEDTSMQVPVPGMVTMVDLGATGCISCKMMTPILEKLATEYEGKAAIVFIDVWQNKGLGRKFGISAIPTQIFFDKEGTEVYRHMGFLGEAAIVAQLTKMGVALPAGQN